MSYIGYKWTVQRLIPHQPLPQTRFTSAKTKKTTHRLESNLPLSSSTATQSQNSPLSARSSSHPSSYVGSLMKATFPISWSQWAVRQFMWLINFGRSTSTFRWAVGRLWVATIASNEVSKCDTVFSVSEKRVRPRHYRLVGAYAGLSSRQPWTKHNCMKKRWERRLPILLLFLYISKAIGHPGTTNEEFIAWSDRRIEMRYSVNM